MKTLGNKGRLALAITFTGLATILPANAAPEASKTDAMQANQNVPHMKMAPTQPGDMGSMSMPGRTMGRAKSTDTSMPNSMPGMDMGQAKPGDMAKLYAPGMNMNQMNMGTMSMHGDFGAYPMNRKSSGTSWQPDLAPAMGRMTMANGWMLMTDARFTGVADSQSGPRGKREVFAEGMLMAMASRDVSSGDTLGLRAMVSPDPLMGRRGYPLLLQTGETADGVTPLVDRQHPHDLLMELAASYSHQLSDSDSAFLYAGYPGEPALGPSTFMHRISGFDDPEAP